MATEVERFATKQDLRDDVREGFSRIELRLEQTERRIEQTERRIERTERRIEQADQVNEALLSAVQAIARKVGAAAD